MRSPNRHIHWRYDRFSGCLIVVALTAIACACWLPILVDASWGPVVLAIVGLWPFYHAYRHARSGRYEAVTLFLTIAAFGLAWFLGYAWFLVSVSLLSIVVGATAMSLWSIGKLK